MANSDSDPRPPLAQGRGIPWPPRLAAGLMAMLSWGLLLALHGLHAYDLLPWTTRGWERRKVRELIIARMRAEQRLDE